MRIRQIIAFIFLLTAVCGSAQVQPQIPLDDKGIIYNQEFSMGLRLHTYGFAFGTSFGKIKTYNQTNYMHFELGELRHMKEVRQNFEIPSSIGGRISRSFKYGKQNNLYVLRGSVGTKKYFSEKAKVKGVAVGISYEGGATLGLLKPYYLDIRSGDGRNAVPTRYSEETASRFLDIWQIHGASSWTNGFDEISLTPGLNAKIAVHFDWGAFDEYLKSVEAGVMFDGFLQKTSIMVERDNVENRLLFINLFVHLQFGKRW
jgi:hypothetical protein